MQTIKQALTAGMFLGFSLLLSACNTTADGVGSSFGNTLSGAELPETVDAYPDDQVLKVAQTQFSEGNYGHAARYFERAVEVTPNDSEAWLGLAASYDRVRRFDLADRAYREVARLIGNQPEYYNNVGYSYLLRGDAVRARSNFIRAHELNPNDITVNNNLELLRDNMSRSAKS